MTKGISGFSEEEMKEQIEEELQREKYETLIDGRVKRNALFE